MDSYLKWKTNASLYGPNRISAKTEVKELLLRDHVLQKGEWDFDRWRLNPWISTCSNTFKNPLPIVYDPRRNTKSFAGKRHLTNLVLGSGETDDLRVATTLKDFDRKWLKTPMKAKPDLGTSIPDFAAKYMLEKKFGHDGSIYANSYNEVKKANTSQNTNERKQYTKDLRTTHFDFGTSQNNYNTETTHIFCPSEGKTQTNCLSLSSQALQETYQSNVFRDGDWNVSGHPSVRYSVTRHDFHVKPFISRGRANRKEKAQKDTPINSLKDELCRAMIDKCTSQGDPTAKGVHQAFAQYDVDKSGNITRDQVKAVICKFRTSTTDEEMESLIDESGALTDKKISYAVFIKYLESSPKSVETEKQTMNIQQESYTGTHYMKTSYPDHSTGKPQDDPRHPYYHVSTHFQFGSHGEDLKSLYYKDFMMGRKETLSKPLPALPPMSSQVLPEVERRLNVLKSTKQSDFVNHSDKGTTMTQARNQDLKKNQTRLAKLSVEISSDPTTAQAYRQASVSGADYPSPPSEFRPMTPRRAPQSRYRFLDTNGTLKVPPADPYVSEQHDKFVSIKNQALKDKKAECLERIGDNRSSHFGFGSDSKPKGTEQHHEFSQKPPLDPSLKAAGKVQTAEQNYSHVYPSESSDKEASRQPEATMDDMSTLQERLKEMNRMKHGIPRDPNNTDVRKAFMDFDPNMTGRISKGDFQQLCSKLQLYIPDEQLHALYDRCHQDKQGNIDYYQFIQNFTKQLALTKGSKPNLSSVMKTDYCPPDQRGFTSAQQRTIDIARNKPYVVVDSHYFHTDSSQGKTPLTTTRHDFSRPDRLSDGPGVTVF